MTREEMLLSAMGNLEDDFLMEANDYNKKKKRPLRGRMIPIAAAIMALFVVTASAVGISLHRMAQSDLGITDVEKVPEYTEYSVEEAPEAGVAESPESPEEASDSPWADGGKVQLVSAFCSGNELVAYIAVPNVTPEMQENLGNRAAWDIGGVLPDGHGWSFATTQVEYEAETETALVKVHLTGGETEGLDAVSFQMTYRCESGDKCGTLYEAVEIPITESTGLYAEVGQTVKSADIDLDVEIVSVEVYAGYISVNLKTKPMEQMYADLGEDTCTTITAAIYGEAYDDETMATFAYLDLIDRVMNVWQDAPGNTPSPDSAVADATINFADGSSMVISQQESPFLAWTAEGDLNLFLETGEIEYRYTLSNPLVLTEVESITILGQTYLLTGI